VRQLLVSFIVVVAACLCWAWRQRVASEPANVLQKQRLMEPLTAQTGREEYGIDQVKRPTTFILRALLSELRAADVPTLFFVAPINVDRLAELRLTGELALPERLAALRDAIGASRNEWADFHALLPR